VIWQPAALMHTGPELLPGAYGFCLLAAIAQETTTSSEQDSSHLFLIVENIGIHPKLVIQAITLGSGDR